MSILRILACMLFDVMASSVIDNLASASQTSSLVFCKQKIHERLS